MRIEVTLIAIVYLLGIEELSLEDFHNLTKSICKLNCVNHIKKIKGLDDIRGKL